MGEGNRSRALSDKRLGGRRAERTKSALLCLMTAGWAAPGIDFLSPGYFQPLRCVWKRCCFSNSPSSRVWGADPLNWICRSVLGRGTRLPVSLEVSCLWGHRAARAVSCDPLRVPRPCQCWWLGIVPIRSEGLEGTRQRGHGSVWGHPCPCAAACPSSHPSTGVRVLGSHGVIY